MAADDTIIDAIEMAIDYKVPITDEEYKEYLEAVKRRQGVLKEKEGQQI